MVELESNEWYELMRRYADLIIQYTECRRKVSALVEAYNQPTAPSTD